MRSLPFANFQVGMVDDPSVETEGGFEYASGMDIFSEPGVIKACLAMEEVSYGAGAAPADVPRWADDISDSTTRMYIAAGAKILESTDGATFSLFLTNANGANLGLKIFDGNVNYASASQLGRAPVGNGAGKVDSYGAIDSDSEYHPMDIMAGGLKIGAGRYLASLAEGGTLTAQAMKLRVGYRVKSLASHLLRVYAGTKFGSGLGATTFADASVFDWNGILLAAGIALPQTPYLLKMRGMHALHSDGSILYGFPETARNVYYNNGVTFQQLRRVFTDAITVGEVGQGAVCQHIDSMLWGGDYSLGAGAFQMKNNAICQAFVPVGHTPGASGSFNIAMLRSAFNGIVFMGYFRDSDSSYHIAKTTANRQNNAVVRTLWHRAKTSNWKRWGGVQLNLKPLGPNCSVAVAYRTERAAAFTNAPYTITENNQDTPLRFAVHPRSREIQYRFTYTTSTTTTPELLSYEPQFAVIN